MTALYKEDYMKLIHTADWHLGKNIDGHSRLEEQRLFLKDFIKICEEEQADMIIIAGDIYDNYNPSAMAEQLFYDTLKQLSRNGMCMIVVISGNHDNPERLTASGPLARDHGIVMAGTPNSIITPGIYGKHEITESAPGYFHANINNEDVDMLLVPFPSEKRLNEVYLNETDEETQKAASYGEKMALLFSSLEEHFHKDSIHLIASHLFVMNSIEDGSERSIQLGGSYMVGGDIFPKTADYIALGHVHKPQKVPGCPKARYSGSPLPFNVKEASFHKQIIAVELTAGSPCIIRELPLPVYKPIEVWHCENVDDAVEQCEANADRECWVYLEIRTDHYIHEEDIKKMKALKADILSITPILPEDETEDFSTSDIKEQPFDELVKNFYRKKFHVDIGEETFSLLMNIIEEN